MTSPIRRAGRSGCAPTTQPASRPEKDTNTTTSRRRRPTTLRAPGQYSAAITGNVLSNDTGNNVVLEKVENLSFATQSTQVVTGTYGVLTISSNGAWSYALNSTKTAFLTLAAGQQAIEDFSYTAKNALGSSSAKIVTIEGRDEPSPPVLTPDNASVTEDSGIAATGNLLGNDGGAPLTVGKVNATTVAATGLTAVAGLYGTLTIAADGTYSYALKDSLDAVDILNNGQTLQESFTYQVTNQYGTDTDNVEDDPHQRRQ